MFKLASGGDAFDEDDGISRVSSICLVAVKVSSRGD
jgi:hypothetical protein